MPQELDHSTFIEQIERDGWAVTTPFVEAACLDEIIAETELSPIDGGGLREVLTLSPATRRLARHPGVRQVAEAILGPECFVARAILFDKTDTANWKVAWHQDLTIAVRERLDMPGYGPWSLKEGVVHVQPTCDVLGRMLAVRVHLDDSTRDNGPLRVLPGSHRSGKLTPEEITAWKDRTAAVECLIKRGGILAFRPLLLHASSQAIHPQHRRVVHFEFVTGGLPGGLNWHTQV